MEALFSSQLVTHGTEKPAHYLRSTDMTLLLFGAAWSVPCKDLVPYLSVIYSQANREYKRLEIVYVSLDPNEAQFREAFREMPWVAVPRHQTSLIEQLRGEFAVDAVPRLVLLRNAQLIQDDCVHDVFNLGPMALKQWEKL